MLDALEAQTFPPEHVILRGPKEDARDWLRKVRVGYTPWRRVYTIPYTNTRTLPGYLPKMVSADRQAAITAYVCSGLSCSLPIESIDELGQALT